MASLGCLHLARVIRLERALRRAKVPRPVMGRRPAGPASRAGAGGWRWRRCAPVLDDSRVGSVRRGGSALAGAARNCAIAVSTPAVRRTAVGNLAFGRHTAAAIDDWAAIVSGRARRQLSIRSGPRPVGRRGGARRRLRCGRRSPITGHFQSSAVRTGSGLRAIRLTWNCASMDRNISCVSRSGRAGGLAWRSHPTDHVGRLTRCSCGWRIADARGRRRRPTTPEHCGGIVCRAGARRLRRAAADRRARSRVGPALNREAAVTGTRAGTSPAGSGSVDRRSLSRHGGPAERWRGVADDERAASTGVDVGPANITAVDVPVSESLVRHDRPCVPRIVASAVVSRVAESDGGSVVPPQRAPAHVARGVRPRHPRRTPGTPGDPEPQAG